MSKRTVHQLRRLAPWGRRLLRPVVGLPLLLLALLAAGPSHADPDYGRGPILYGLDPVLRATEDPRLLGVERLVLRRRLVDMGVDPVRRPDLRPGLSASFAKHMTDKARVDLISREYLVEYNGLPAVTYDGSGGDNTLYSAATSSAGETWSVPQSISQTFLGVDGGARPQGMYVYEGVPQVAIQQWRFHRNVLVHGADGGTTSWSKPEQISCYDLLDIHCPLLDLGPTRHMLYVSGNRLLMTVDTLH